MVRASFGLATLALLALGACSVTLDDTSKARARPSPSDADDVEAGVGSTGSGPGGADGGARGPSAADAWLGVDRDATFRAHVERVRGAASISAAGLARLGTTWDKELEGVRALYATARSEADVYYALVALKNSLHDGHAYLVADALAPRSPGVRLPLRVRVELEAGGARYVVRAGAQGVPDGALILAVDGRPLAELEASFRTWMGRGSSPDMLREELARWIAARVPALEPSPAPGARAVLRVREPSGAESERTLVWTAAASGGDTCPPYADPCEADAEGDYTEAPTFVGLGYCVYRAPAADLRVVRYRTLYYPDTSAPSELACLRKKLGRLSYALSETDATRLGPRELLVRDQNELLSHLARENAQRVLFDVRENTGGDFDPTFFGAFTRGSYAQPSKAFVYGAWFKEDPARVRAAQPYVATMDGNPVAGAAEKIEQHLRANPAAATSPRLPFYCRTAACGADEATLTSQSNVVFRAALLTGPACFSACDDFVSIFRGNGLAKTIGQPTGAGDSPYALDLSLPLGAKAPATLHVTVGVSYHPGTDRTLEGNPLPLDVPLAPAAANRGRYLATAIERAPF